MERFMTPIVVTDPACIQAWLEDHAARGRFFIKMSSGFFALFDEGTPKSIRYRLEPLQRRKKQPDEDHRDLCRAMGWEYVARYSGFWVWRCDDPDAPEFYTDPQVQGEAYRNLLRKNRLFYWVLLAELAVLGGLFAWLYAGCDGYLYRLIHSFEPFWHILVYPLCTITVLLVSIVQSVSLRRFTRRLCRGIPQINRRPYRGVTVMSVLLLACYLYWIGASLIWLLRPSSYPFVPVAEFDQPVPYISLARLDSSGGFDEPEAIFVENCFTRRQWWVSEIRWADENRRSWLATCHTEYYDLRLPFLAKPLAGSIAEQAASTGAAVSSVPDPGPGLDGAYTGTYSDGAGLLICWSGRQVMSVFWGGGIAPDVPLTEYAALLEAYS